MVTTSSTVLSSAELQSMRRSAKRAAPVPRQPDNAGDIVHSANAGSRPSSGRHPHTQYKQELEQQMTRNRSRKAEQRAEDQRLVAQADAEAEKFDYWRKPRPGGGTPNQPQYLADRGGELAYRPSKKGMASPSDSTRGHRRAESSGAVSAASSGGAPRVPRHGNHSRAMSEAYAGTNGASEDGGRGFFDYFFNPRPGGGTPVRGQKGEVVANLRTALAADPAADGYDHIAHETAPQQGFRPAPDAGAWAGGTQEVADDEGAREHAIAAAPLHASPIQPSRPNVTAGRRASPLREDSDTRSELAQRTILALQGQLQEALAGQREQEEELDATKAQLDMAVQLLEEYKQLYGPLPAKGE